jgi:hypothetical protein
MSFLTDSDPFSKFIFIVMLLIGFIVLLNISMAIITYIMQNPSPYIVKGMIPGNMTMVIQQDPTITGAIPIERSDNKDGIEFTWSVWLNITDIGNKSNQNQHIFHKGEMNIDTGTGLNFPNNAPGLYISPNTNELVVIMNTFNVINEEVKIPNFPMNKWVHVVIRVMNNNALDIYINGALAKRHILSSVPKQNYGNVYVALNGGFAGNLSNLRYFNYALQPGELLSITDSGPDLTVNSKSVALNSVPPYLSMQWYTDNV